MTRIRLLVAAAILCLVGGFFAAGPAGAAVAPAAHSAVAASPDPASGSGGAMPQAHGAVRLSNKTCPVQFSRFRIYNKNCALVQRASLCFTGNHGNFRGAPKFASNGCIFRVWIYTARNEAGHALCISPRTPTNSLKQEYLSFRVVNNKDSCK
jgi:hypothetical protein